MTIENGEIMVAKKQSKCFSILSTALSAISLIVSIVVFLFATYPQLNRLNTNPIAKANAGHSESQLFLAHHCYEIGDVEESYYWYKIASTTEGKYQATALNNLAYLELTYLKTNDTSINYVDKALKVLNVAIELDEITALKNKYILLLSSSEKFFKDIDYLEEIKSAEKQLIAKSIDLSDFDKYRQNWILKDTVYNAEQIPKDTNVYRFEMTGCDYVYNDNSSFKWIYTYEIYEKEEKSVTPKYEYIDFN